MSLPKFGKVPRRGIKMCGKRRSLLYYFFMLSQKLTRFDLASAADEVVKRIPPQRDLPFIFVILFFTPSVAYGDSSLKREPRQEFELHFAASERDQYFVRLCDFKFDAKTMVFAGIK